MPPDEIPLRDYLDTRIKSVELQIESLAKFTALHFKLNEEAIRKADEAMLLRLEGMNQFREQISEERMGYATKEAMESRLKALEMSNAFSAGKLWMVMALFAAVPTILALIALFKG